MQMTAFSFLFRGNTASSRFGHSRFGQLSRLLGDIHSQIAREIEKTRSTGDRLAICAAFALEAVENGADLTPKVERLERDLIDNRRRTALLERQERFVAAMRSRLDMFVSRRSQPEQADAHQVNRYDFSL